MDNLFQNQKDVFGNVGLTPKSKNPGIDPLRVITANKAAQAGNNALFQSNYLDPTTQRTLQNLIQGLTNTNYGAQANRAENSVIGQYGQQARNNAIAAQRMGLGAATGLGMNNAVSSAASRQAAAAAESYRDPRRKIQDLLQAFGVLGQAKQMSNYDTDALLALSQFLEQHYMNSAQKKAMQFQSGIGGVIGQLAGMYAAGQGSRSPSQGGDSKSTTQSAPLRPLSFLRR